MNPDFLLPRPVHFDVQISLINGPVELSIGDLDAIRALMDEARDAALGVLGGNDTRASIAAAIAIVLRAYAALLAYEAGRRPLPLNPPDLRAALDGAMSALQTRFEQEFPDAGRH